MARDSEHFWYNNLHILKGINNIAYKINGFPPEPLDLIEGVGLLEPKDLSNNGNIRVILSGALTFDQLGEKISNSLEERTTNTNIIIPVNFANHWISCVLKFDSEGNCTPHLFNSMNSHGKLFNNNGVNYFKGTPDQELTRINITPNTEKLQNIQYMPAEDGLFQADDSSCGPISVVNAIAMAYDKTAMEVISSSSLDTATTAAEIVTFSTASGDRLEATHSVRVLNDYKKLVSSQLEEPDSKNLDLTQANTAITRVVTQHSTNSSRLPRLGDNDTPLSITTPETPLRNSTPSVTSSDTSHTPREGELDTIIRAAKSPNATKELVFNAIKETFGLDRAASISNNPEIQKKVQKIIDVAKNLAKRESMGKAGKLINNIVSFFRRLKKEHAENALENIRTTLQKSGMKQSPSSDQSSNATPSPNKSSASKGL
jgi:hypothetical protein